MVKLRARICSALQRITPVQLRKMQFKGTAEEEGEKVEPNSAE